MLYEYRFCALTDDHASSIDWDMEHKRMPNCPLVELPPHGRLIDADEQIERAWRLNLSTRELIEEMLKTAVTVIPPDV